MKLRITDADGKIFIPIKGWRKAVVACNAVFDDLEARGVDRADMYKVLSDMHADMLFHLRFLANPD